MDEDLKSAELINYNLQAKKLSNQRILAIGKKNTCNLACNVLGYLNVRADERFLLLDEIYDATNEREILVVNSKGSVGYISLDTVEFIVVHETEAWPFFKSLLTSFYKQNLHSVNSEKTSVQNTKNHFQGKDVIDEFITLLELLKEPNPIFNVDKVLVEYSKLIKGKILGLEFKALGSNPIKELVNCYLKETFLQRGKNILNLLLIMVKTNPFMSSYLIDTDFPAVLIMDIIHTRYDDEQRDNSLNLLLYIIESQSGKIKPTFLKNLSKRFLMWLIENIEKDFSSDKLRIISTRILAAFHDISYFSTEVVSVILTSYRPFFPILLISMAREYGINSQYWHLLANILSCEDVNHIFSKSCTEKIVNLVWNKKQFVIENPEAYLKVVENACRRVCIYTKSSDLVEKLEECLKITYKELPEKHDTIWTIWKSMQGRTFQPPSNSKIMEVNSTLVAYLPKSLMEESKILNQILKTLNVYEEEDNISSNLNNIINLLSNCHKLVNSFNLLNFGNAKSANFPYNLTLLHIGLNAISNLFSKFFIHELQKQAILCFSKLCLIFPSVTQYALQLKMIPLLINELDYFRTQDLRLYESIVITLTLLFSDNCDSLPIPVSETLTESFVVCLINTVENEEDVTIREHIVCLILATNLYKKDIVLKAFGKTPAPQALQIIISFLKRNFDPLFAYTSNPNLFSLVKIYSDILESDQAIKLMRCDYLQSVMEYSINYLEVLILGCLGDVPEELCQYLKNILLNSLQHFKLHLTEVLKIEDGLKILNKKPIIIKHLQHILHDIKDYFVKKQKINEFLPGSVSCIEFLLPVKDYLPRSTPSYKSVSEYRISCNTRDNV